MKFKLFNQDNLPKQQGGGYKSPRVSFNKSGVIGFNLRACTLMELTPDDKISLVQDEDEPDNWYFLKDPKTGFQLRESSNKKSYIFNHCKMIEELLNFSGLDIQQSYSFLIAGQPTIVKPEKTKYWGILITR